MRSVALGLLFCLLATGAVRAEKKVEPLAEAPQGLSEEVTGALQPSGFRVSDDAGVICDIWLAKEAPLKPKFKPSLRVKYPFQLGQLVGAIRYPEGSKPSDFRGQPLKAGLYTLRYGLQPDDGNHLGTSDLRGRADRQIGRRNLVGAGQGCGPGEERRLVCDRRSPRPPVPGPPGPAADPDGSAQR